MKIPNDPFAELLTESRSATAPRVSVPVRDQVRPQFDIQISDTWMVTRRTTPANPFVPDIGGLRFDAEFEALSKFAQRPLGRIEVDFLWIAVAVYFADRLSPRYPYGNSGTGYWRRKINVCLRVSNSEFWREQEARLCKLLCFLTEDDWTFEFSEGRPVWNFECQTHFPQMMQAGSGWAALFSGGLDSFAGAVHALKRFEGSGVLVSGQTCSRIAMGQHEQVAALHERFKESFQHVGMGYGFVDKQGVVGLESSQRTRAFVHVALGSLTAIMNGVDQLHLFENGFGALNLSCDAAQIGSQNSRGTHPVFLRRMSDYVSVVFCRPFQVTNPFLYRTKAEMLRVPGVADESVLFARTFSCDRYPNYPHRASQCGVCPSCLVRRQSLHAAQLSDPGQGYQVDVLQPRARWREREVAALSKLAWQADALSEVLRQDDPWPSLIANWPELFRAERELGAADFRDAVTRLLRQHVSEWRAFADVLPILYLAEAA